MRQRVVLSCVVVGVVGLSGCGGGSSSGAAGSSAAWSSGIAAVAAANSSKAAPSPSSTASSLPSASGVAKSGSSVTPPLVDAHGNPVIPAAARVHTDAGAIAFTKYYIALLDYLDQHPDPRIGRSVDAEDCSACDEMNAVLKNSQQKGIHFVGSHTSLTALKTQFSPDRSQVIVSFRQSKVPCVRIDGPGKVVPLTAAKFDTRLLLLWEKEGWRVGNMGSDPA